MCYIYSKLLEIVDILAYMSVIEPNLEQMLVNYKPICKKPLKNCINRYLPYWCLRKYYFGVI